MYTVQIALAQIEREHFKAVTKFPVPFTCRHHAIGVIREEYLELEQEIFRSEETVDIDKIRKEAIQLAAMCVKLLTEVDETNLNPRA